MIKYGKSVSEEKKVICASTGYRSVADTPKHIINISASSWLLSVKGSLLVLVWPATEVIITNQLGYLRALTDASITVFPRWRSVTMQ